MLQNFLFFMLGFTVCFLISPIWDSLVTLIVTAFEIPKAKMALKIAQKNQEIDKLSDDKQPMRAIGFKISEDEEYCLEDEEE